MKKNTILQLVAGIFLFGTTACTSNFEEYNKIEKPNWKFNILR